MYIIIFTQKTFFSFYTFVYIYQFLVNIKTPYISYILFDRRKMHLSDNVKDLTLSVTMATTMRME